MGGYSQQIVVEEHFVLHVSEKLDPAATAPLLCAGITTYCPLRHWQVGPGDKIGIVGLGALGHMGVKFVDALRRTRCDGSRNEYETGHQPRRGRMTFRQARMAVFPAGFPSNALTGQSVVVSHGSYMQ